PLREGRGDLAQLIHPKDARLDAAARTRPTGEDGAGSRAGTEAHLRSVAVRDGAVRMAHVSLRITLYPTVARPILRDPQLTKPTLPLHHETDRIGIRCSDAARAGGCGTAINRPTERNPVANVLARAVPPRKDVRIRVEVIVAAT